MTIKPVSLSLIVALCAMISLASKCHEQQEDDSVAPTITINSPAEAANIQGDISIDIDLADESLHQVAIKIVNASDNSVLFNDVPEIHNLATYKYTKTFTPTGLSDGSSNLALVVAVEDHNANIATKEVKFVVIK